MEKIIERKDLSISSEDKLFEIIQGMGKEFGILLRHIKISNLSKIQHRYEDHNSNHTNGYTYQQLLCS